jgi:hypothetical protein
MKHTETKLTPTPWKVLKTAYSKGYNIGIVDPKNKFYIADCIKKDEDADHIVKCVNAHDELMELLNDSLIFVRQCNNDTGLGDMMLELQLRDALKKYGGASES